jgi:hypothetical protein
MYELYVKAAGLSFSSHSAFGPKAEINYLGGPGEKTRPKDDIVHLSGLV